jgi:hypothetical protein
MQACDGNLYVVKFQCNPQGTSVLANEMLAAKLAANLGLPVPTTAVVELPPKLSEELYFETPNGRQPILPGRHLGSRLVLTSLEGRSYDSLPQSYSHLVRNPEDFIGIELFDIWTCNRDQRQFIYWKYSHEKKFRVTFIDNGHCFGGPGWSFAPLKCQKSFWTTSGNDQAWLRWTYRLAALPLESTEADLIPSEWGGGGGRLAGIYEALRIRRAILGTEITNRLKGLGLNTTKQRTSMEHLGRTTGFSEGVGNIE